MFPAAGNMPADREARREAEGNVFMGAEIEDNSNLQLDTGSVRDRSGVRSSLTDINQIDVFTDVFTEKKEVIEKERQTAMQELHGTVFIEPLNGQAETELTDLIFLDSTEELLIRNEQETVESRSGAFLWILPIMIILFTVSLFYQSSRKGKIEDDADNQSEAIA